MLLKQGWLVDARHVPSPHYDCRPDDEAPSLLVVHNISLPPGEFGGPWIDALFTGTLDPDAHPFFAEIVHLRVSAHCLIRRDGEIVQYVPFDKRAWHAGVSVYEGRERCNDFSIGIELEGTDNQAYTDAQYTQLAKVTHALIGLFPMIASTMPGHSDIAPVRKTDPGPAFAWDRFRAPVADKSDNEMPFPCFTCCWS